MWLVTGAGRGIGRAVVEAALAAGDEVVATVRRPEAREDLLADHGERLRVAMVDVRDRAAVADVVDAAVAGAGRLDVVVNNAGHGLVGAVEEASEQDVRDGGHVVQVSTVGGVGTMPTLGLYNAGKWALEGFSEALAAEVGRFGIRVTIAELGGFATDWAGSSMAFARPLPAYDELRTELYGTPTVPWDTAAADTGEADDGEADDGEAGDGTADHGSPPEVAARAILAHVDAPAGPLRLLVGDDAPVHVAMALAVRRDDYACDPRFTWPAAG